MPPKAFWVGVAVTAGLFVVFGGVEHFFGPTKNAPDVQNQISKGQGEMLPYPKDENIRYEYNAETGKYSPVARFNAKTGQYESLELPLTDPAFNNLNPRRIEMAKAGNEVSQWMLGTSYYEGKDVHRNYGEAAKWWIKSAQQGFVSAKLDLASLYLDGFGVPYDPQKAVRLYTEIINQEPPDPARPVAMYKLGYCYINGTGVGRNFKEAVRLISLAAEVGHSAAQQDLGSFYLNGGLGLPKNEELGKLWLKRSEESKARLANLTKGSESKQAFNYFASPSSHRLSLRMSRKPTTSHSARSG